jgi:hypothetical protein
MITRRVSCCACNNLSNVLQVVIVSPLTRTLETAVGVFGGNTIPEESAMDVDGSPPDVLMVGQGAVENTRSARPSVAAPTGLPFIACELCRERVGELKCLLLPCKYRGILGSPRFLTFQSLWGAEPILVAFEALGSLKVAVLAVPSF